MKRNAFTLIELLAVIVILAIIALIAVPIVLNIINDSKTSSDEQSVELYLDTVEKAITKKQLSNPSFNPDKCEIQSNGDLDCYKTNNKIETLKVDIEGEHPEKGTIELKDNKFIYKNILLDGKYYYERGILVEDADNNNEISIGDKYTYKVNDAYKFFFYVLSFNDDSTVNLIMDRNICGSAINENLSTNGKPATELNNCLIEWYKSANNIPINDNSKGPITAMQGLYNATKNWNNVPNMNLEYDDILDQISAGYTGTTMYGYSGISIVNGIGTIVAKNKIESVLIGTVDYPLKARLPMVSEVMSVSNNCSELYAAKCKSWLTSALRIYLQYYSENDHISTIYGYWLLSSHASQPVYARRISFYGSVNSYGTSNLEGYGIRPVITVPITDLSN